jgi:hypothetical protein
LPSDDSFGLNEHQRTAPAAPDFRQSTPEQAVRSGQHRSPPRTLKCAQLESERRIQIHQGRNRDINQTPYAVLPSIYQGLVNPDLFRQYLGFSHIYVNGRDGTSRYNALQFSANHRFTAGVEFQVAYTWSRLISDTLNQDTEGLNSPAQDAFNLRAERALGTQDQPQTVTINYIWELPFFKKSSNKLLKGSLGGWELAGIYIAHSGLPQNVCLDHDVVGLSDGGTICQRPNLVAKPNLDRDKQRIAEYFNTSALGPKTRSRSIDRGWLESKPAEDNMLRPWPEFWIRSGAFS